MRHYRACGSWLSAQLIRQLLSAPNWRSKLPSSARRAGTVRAALSLVLAQLVWAPMLREHLIRCEAPVQGWVPLGSKVRHDASERLARCWQSLRNCPAKPMAKRCGHAYDDRTHPVGTTRFPMNQYPTASHPIALRRVGVEPSPTAGAATIPCAASNSDRTAAGRRPRPTPGNARTRRLSRSRSWNRVHWWLSLNATMTGHPRAARMAGRRGPTRLHSCRTGPRY